MSILLPFVIGHAVTAILYAVAHHWCRHWYFLWRYATGIVCGLAGCLVVAVMTGEWIVVVAPAVVFSAGGWVLLLYAVEQAQQADYLRRARLHQELDTDDTQSGHPVSLEIPPKA